MLTFLVCAMIGQFYAPAQTPTSWYYNNNNYYQSTRLMRQQDRLTMQQNAIEIGRLRRQRLAEYEEYRYEKYFADKERRLDRIVRINEFRNQEEQLRKAGLIHKPEFIPVSERGITYKGKLYSSIEELKNSHEWKIDNIYRMKDREESQNRIDREYDRLLEEAFKSKYPAEYYREKVRKSLGE